MTGVLGKLLRKEFGGRYESLCKDIRTLEGGRIEYTAKLYFDMYRVLEAADMTALKRKKQQLEETLWRMHHICQHYTLVMFSSVVTLFLLYYINPAQEVLLPLSVIWLIAYGRKTSEYIANRYCLTDTKLMIVYQAVLEQLFEVQKQKQKKQ
ncbi:MAG: hypothetical protein IJY09_04575 [Lachnospiraceae bacterium]|nr:hypothetical protein [Lachnospiraceae bacterium]